MIFGMGDVKTGLVQPRRPAQRHLRERILEPPALLDLLQQRDRGGFDSIGLLVIDVIALLHRAHAAHPRIFIREAPDQVVEQALAHRAIGGA